MGRTAGATVHAPPPSGPYSQSVRVGNIVAASGHGGLTPTGDLPDSLEDQAWQAFQNVVAALAASGADPEDVISVRVYLTDQDDFEPMNAVYKEFFSEPYPARTTVFVGLYPGLKIEVDALAVGGG